MPDATRTSPHDPAGAARTSAGPRAPRAPASAPKVDVPVRLAPQLATLVDAPPATGEWLYEAKFDGYRMLARIDGGAVTLRTRGGHDWTARMPHLARALANLRVRATWIDGEVIVSGASGAPDFQALQNAFDSGRDADMQFCAFDLPYYAGRDLRQLPLVARRDVLRRLVACISSPAVALSEDFGGDGDALLRTACGMGLEGVIGKRRDARYRSGRSATWIKLKCSRRQEFVVGGFTAPEGTRKGLGSLLLGVRDPAGRLVYAGNVGTGFDDAELARLRARLERLRTDASPFVDRTVDPKVQWVRPTLVAEVSYAQWTRDGRLRHAVYHGLRDDIAPARVVREAAPASRAGAAKRPPAAPATAVSNADRVIDASSGLTKLDLVRYYEFAARWMLPHLKERPVALLRAPKGIGDKTFFQKHPATLRIPGLEEIVVEHDGERDTLIEIPSIRALLGAGQMNTIEFHAWNATTRAIESPDCMVFDLDPGEGVGWPAVREAAWMVREVLDALGLASCVKTSGGRGLHVIVPCVPRHGWDDVKRFSREIVVHVARIVPQRFVAKSGPRNRVGRIFIDYLRNGRGATTVAAYSARARPGLGVSMPIRWEELADVDDAAQWTIANAVERLSTQAQDPWHGVRTARQGLAKAMRALGFKPGG
jgi:bifunctional non-homologous end joining protein LigD